MKKSPARNLAVITLVYWLVLLYSIAALVWWLVALERQNTQITEIRLAGLTESDPQYVQKKEAVLAANKRKTAQYLGEGITFMMFILLGAVFVYRATRKQLRLSKQQQNFMMAVTHELKTPIAVTRLNLETLQKRKLDEEKQQKLIQNTLSEANRLNTLCNNILLSAQLEAGQYTVNFQEFNMSEMIASILKQYQTRFPARQIVGNIGDEIFVNGEILLIEILVNNLLDNALKYSPKTGRIGIELNQDAHYVVLQVWDEGKGIPLVEREAIFGKFYRGGDEGVRTTQGTGLGLYLCKKIAEDHGADIRVTEHHCGGSNFVVRFKTT
jgi:K+-sensing histidine kinase KdpD